MQTKKLYLRICFWTGAVIDALTAILLTFPKVMALVYNLGSIEMNPAFRSVDSSAAGLMWGWTFLLIWADRKPFERRFVLFLTIIPVLLFLIFSRFLDLIFYPVDFLSQPPFLFLQLSLVILFSTCLWVNRKEKTI